MTENLPYPYLDPAHYPTVDPEIIRAIQADLDELNRRLANVTPPSGSASAHAIQDEGTSLTQRTILDFQGAGVTVTDGATKTIVTIPETDVRAILASLDAGVDLIAWEKVGTNDDVATIYAVVTAGSTTYTTVDSDGFGTTYSDLTADPNWTLLRLIGAPSSGAAAGPPFAPTGQVLGRTLTNRIYYRPGEAARENSRTSFQVVGYQRYTNIDATGTDCVVVKRLAGGDLLMVGKQASEYTPYPAAQTSVGLENWHIYEWVAATDALNLIATVATARSAHAAGHYIRVQQQGNDLTMEQWTGDPAGAGALVESSTYTLTGATATKFGTGITGKGGMVFDQAEAFYDNYLRESVTATEARELWVSITDELGVTTARKLLDADGLSEIGHQILDDGTAKAQRPKLNFINATVADDSANERTDITIPLVRRSRVTTGSIAAATEATVTITWATEFANTNYTVSAEVEEATAGSTLEIQKIESRSTTQTVIRVRNNDAVTARTGTIHAIAYSD